VVQPAWLEAVQETFEAKGITDRVDEFIKASGTHIVRTYKENIERARRTRGLSGIQLLDIRDFPGQGHATTGILDMFWDSKGLVEPQIFAQSNSAVVLLMRAPSPTFWNGQSANVDIEVSNFGREPVAAGALRWSLFDRSGDIHLRGEVSVPVAEAGQITLLARLNIALPEDGRAHGWTLTVQHGNAENSWHLWSFPYPGVPENPDTIISRLPPLKNALPGATFSDNFDGTALTMWGERALSQNYQLAIAERLSSRLLQYLYDGGSVWLMPGQREVYDFVRTRYLPPFWSYLHFPDNVSSVMGMIIHEHPALKHFPHDGFSDWQWYNLVNDTPAICIDSVPFVSPIVEVVDNFNRAKRLCYAFEAQVGRGRLFVSTWRLNDPAVAGRPEARFLLSEMVRYLRGEAFAPAAGLSVGQLLSLFRLTNGMAGDFLE
jgi:beta-galactosidase